jgi:hypothetical protein
MKNARHSKAESGADTQANFDTIPAQRKFTGTQNPRHLRAINALLIRPRPREELDRVAGCSNGPELVAELRRRGLDVPCERVECIDRDGLPVKRGIYHFTQRDRFLIHRWLSKRDRANTEALDWILRGK